MHVLSGFTSGMFWGTKLSKRWPKSRLVNGDFAFLSNQCCPTKTCDAAFDAATFQWNRQLNAFHFIEMLRIHLPFAFMFADLFAEWETIDHKFKLYFRRKLSNKEQRWFSSSVLLASHSQTRNKCFLSKEAASQTRSDFCTSRPALYSGWKIENECKTKTYHDLLKTSHWQPSHEMNLGSVIFSWDMFLARLKGGKRQWCASHGDRGAREYLKDSFACRSSDKFLCCNKNQFVHDYQV